MDFKLLLVIILLTPISVFSQKYVDKADEAFNASAYTKAIDLYKSAYSKLGEEPVLKARITFNIGFCYRKLDKMDHAELWFGKSAELHYPDPIVYLYWADAMRINEKFDDAIKQYKKYNSFVKNDERYENGIKSCSISKKWMEKPTRYKIVNNAYLNSENSDFSPAFSNDKNTEIIFSSSRQGTTGTLIHEGSGQPFSDLFKSSKNDKGEWSQPQLLENTINTEVEEGSPNLSSDFNLLYFTRCEFSTRKASYCKIFGTFKDGGSWSKPEHIKLLDNKKDTFMLAHPAISPDRLRLYFVSDMPGGQGGYDIWYCERATTDDVWNAPVNAGTVINTKGNEMFPYVRQDGTLYFSSDGHHGMGGLDIFRVNKDTKGKDQLVNLMYPINSTADDYGITFETGSERGFFSSNRKGSKGLDDIWQFSLPPLKFSVTGSIKSENNDKPIPGAKVKLIGNDGSSKEVISDAQGNYKLDLNPSTNYIVMSTIKGYLNGKGKITTDGLEENKDFKLDIYMTNIDIPVEVQNILYDVGRWDLRPESIVSLEKLVEILNDNPSITIELSSHTDYRLGGRVSNQDLSQNRAQAVVDFLIIKGIDGRRLVPKGYGDSKPKTVDKKTTNMYPFMKEGQVLDRTYIETLPADQREMAHQVNRRTEFKVLSSNFSK